MAPHLSLNISQFLLVFSLEGGQLLSMCILHGGNGAMEPLHLLSMPVLHLLLLLPELQYPLLQFPDLQLEVFQLLAWA